MFEHKQLFKEKRMKFYPRNKHHCGLENLNNSPVNKKDKEFCQKKTVLLIEFND